VAVVAVVGLGEMGSRVAGRLLETGHEVVVWNRTPARAARVVELGAAAAESPAEAARRAEAVFTVVSDAEALRAVTEGPTGLAAGASAATTVVQMSTVAPADVSRLAAALPDPTALLDAPVLGSVAEVESGSLQILAGGPPELVERLEPLLSALGSPLHVGPVGAGSAAKLVANAALFGVVALLGETLALAGAAGLPREVAFEVLARSPLAAQAERRRTSIEAGEYPRRFSLSLARKDVDLILAAAAAGGVELRLGEAVATWLAAADAAGWGNRDYTAVLARILAPAGSPGQRVDHPPRP
jgi:3-hydroxyisobutyrate dehydrogenase/2-hydroxy-3-oxopropionate reductase